jgi:hypothetical protein
MSKKSEIAKDGTPTLIDSSLHKKMRDDIREGSKAVDELTSVTAQIVYRGNRKKKRIPKSSCNCRTYPIN